MDGTELTDSVVTTDIAAMLMWDENGRAIVVDPARFDKFLTDIGIMEDNDRAAARGDRTRIGFEDSPTREGSIIDMASPQRMLSKK